jgi:hypothetical protein
MGKNNKARRAAKAKVRAKARSQGVSGEPSPGAGWGDPRRQAHGSSTPPAGEQRDTAGDAALAHRLLQALAYAESRRSREAIGALRALVEAPARIVDGQAEALLRSSVSNRWADGWQPVELNRQGRRGCPTAAGARLVSLAIAADHVNRRSVTLDSRWTAQIEALGLPAVDGRSGWIRRWCADERLPRVDAVNAMIDALANLVHLPPLEPILPPPGSGANSSMTARSARTGGVNGVEANPMLERIRNLLAKAESTTFEAEASALTAKAQQLMTRHAIDAAVVQGRSRSGCDEPLTIRVMIDAPYVDAKSLLLQTVAVAGRCRAVFHSNLALSTVVGFPADLGMVEMLFTSLLLQAQTGLADAARRAPAGTRTRSQGYRSTFLLAYTSRIGDRLAEINDAVYAEVEAEQGSGFLPVLRSNSEAIDDFMTEKFGVLQSSQIRGGYDAAGAAGGRLAADNAALTSGGLPDET